MRIYFAGGENPGHRKRLIEWGAKSVAINFAHLIPRLPKKSPFLVEERFPADVRVMVHFDVPDEAPELIDLYRQFVEDNVERLDFAIEPSGAVTEDDLRAWREDSPSIPIWNPEDGHRALQRLSESFSGIAVPQSAFDSDRPVTARLNRLVTSEGTHVHGLGVSKWDLISTVAFGSISSGAWISAQRYGETQIWDGTTLRRFPATEKDARAEWRAHIVRSGLDAEKIEADDKDEVGKLALWSWQQVEDSMSRRREVSTEVEIGRVVSDTTENGHGGDLDQRDNAAPVTTAKKGATRNRATVPLPVASFGKTDEGDDAFEISHATFRSCDNCSLDAVCPSFDPGSSCAYEIPVRIRTKDQLIGMLNGVIEMQTQRVMFARFREDLEGSIDTVVSSELDRLMKLTAEYKDIIDNAETFKLQVEAKGGAGVLSRLFGAKVGDTAKELPGGGLDDLQTAAFFDQIAQPIIDLP